jgi:hypothetical protein
MPVETLLGGQKKGSIRLELFQKNRISHYSGSPTGIRFLLSNFGNLAIPNIQDPWLSAP